MTKYTDLQINYAFQNTISWGGRVWKLNEDDIAEIRGKIDTTDVEKTGMDVWTFFREKFGKGFYTSHTFKRIGEDFFNHLNKY
jgi:hypothetical protein